MKKTFVKNNAKKKLGISELWKKKIYVCCTVRFFEVPQILEQLLKGVVL
jgi:hypothetical protein